MSRGEGSGEGAHATLLSETLQPNGREETGTRPGVWLGNKPMDLSASVSEERGGMGRVGVGVLLCCQIHYIQIVAQEQARDLGFGCAINQRT